VYAPGQTCFGSSRDPCPVVYNTGDALAAFLLASLGFAAAIVILLGFIYSVGGGLSRSVPGSRELQAG